MNFQKLPSGRWRVRIYRRGKTVSKVFDSKTAARLWAEAKEHELALVKAGGFPKHTCREAFQRFREEAVPHYRNTYQTGMLLNTVERRWPWCDKAISEVTPQDVAKWRDARLKTVSPSSVLREKAILSAIWTLARREWGWCGASPFKDVRFPSMNPPRTRRISEDEIRRLSEALPPEASRVFRFAIETAMRKSEILGLAWDDIKGHTAILHQTKNGTSRVVPLSDKAVAILAECDRDGASVFGLSVSAFTNTFIDTKKRLGLKDLHFHDTRREATSRMSKKVNVLTLARITGHKQINQLMTYYNEDMEDIAKRL